MRRLAAALALAAAACTSSDTTGVPDRMLRPTFVAADRTDRLLTYVLDTARSSVFAWDGHARTWVTGRAPGPKTPAGYIGIAMGTDSKLDKLDAIFKGFAVSQTATAMAALYAYGFEDRVGHLTVVNLTDFPVEPGTNRGWAVAADAIGPFATPDETFVVVEPVTAAAARWRVFPGAGNPVTGPNATRLIWSRSAKQVLAADPVNETVHVLSWPELAPVTDIAVAGRPLDLALHPVTSELAVITSNRLVMYGPPPTYAVERSIPQSAMPIRVAFARHHLGALVAVLNQNTTLAFYDTATLCGVDADSEGFAAVDVTFTDAGAFSDPSLGDVATLGCASGVPDQTWRLVYEGQIAGGKGTLRSAESLTANLTGSFAAVGDLAFVGRAPTRVTAVTDQALYFAALTAPAAAGSPVTFAVYAAGDWVVAGTQAGLVGRVATGETFRKQLRFVVNAGASAPTRGDTFTFTSRAGVTPILLGGVPSDMAEDRFGRFVVTIPQNQEARAINLKRIDDAWVIQTLYAIP